MNKSKPQQRARRVPNRRTITVQIVPVPHTPESAACAYAVVGRAIANALTKLHHRAADVQISLNDGDCTRIQAAKMIAKNTVLSMGGRLA